MEQISAVKQREDRTGVPGYIDFSVSVAREDDAVTLYVTGDLDCYTAPRLRAALLGLVDDGARQVVLDVGGTQFVDSTGLSVLVGGLKRFRDRGGNMVLRSPNDTTRRLFEVTGLSTVFEIS
jgi:anti-sigma B factor antagonist